MKYAFLPFAAFLLVPFSALADTNIAPNGTAIMGYTTDPSDLNDYGTNYRGNGGPLSDINDGYIGQGGGIDEYGEPGGSNSSDAFVGIDFSSPVTNLQVNSVNLYMDLFGDGGWFGPQNTTGDGTFGVNDFGSTLTANALTVPTLQYLPDGADPATGWVTAALLSSNYLTAMEGQVPGQTLGAYTVSPELTFTLATPITDFSAIRLIGPNGGVANGGFIGINEMQVEAGAVPEPSTWALMLGGAALLAFAVRRCALGA